MFVVNGDSPLFVWTSLVAAPEKPSVFFVENMSFWQPGSKQPVDQKPSGNDKKNIPQGNDKKTAPLSSEKKGQETRASNSSVGTDGKASLSKGVMTMKFMKRKSDADAEGKEMAEKRRKQLDSAWASEGMSDLAFIAMLKLLFVLLII